MPKRANSTAQVRSEYSDPTGDEAVTVSLPPDLLEQIDDWAGRDEITRSEAIRRLVEIGLRTKSK